MLRRYLADNYTITTIILKSFPGKWLSGFYLLLLLFLPKIIFAEGSKDLNSNGGNRAFLYSGSTAQASFPFPTLGTMKVYVKAGETIYLGSSAQGVGTGTINLRAPDGATYTSGTSATVGLIANRVQELAGPQPNGGGYTPYTRTATATQEGVWEVDFIAPSSANDVESNPTPIAAGSNWVQPSGSYIAAFDISVRNTANSTFLSGRVFTNIFCGLINNYNTGFYGILHILTKDGYQYILDNNGQSGNGFSFFVNNKGFRTAGGAASYQSVNNTINPNVQDPRAPDTQSDITHKIFFNAPAADLPATANTPGGGSTWLANPPFVPSVSDVIFTGTEGTKGKSGTSPLGGTISFTATNNGTYKIVIDANQNGVFTDAVDRTLTGTSTSGPNSITWDGLDGLGNKLPAGPVNYAANVTIQLFSAEVHFPFFDVERNVNGIKLTRTGGAGAPDNTIYWDDSQISLIGTPSSPLQNTTGVSSLFNGHKWGSATADPSNGIDFGDNRSMDTWAYVSSAPTNTTVNFTIQEADLEVNSLTSDVITGCVGQKITYKVVVKNNGPSDVTNAPFSFTFPKELTGVKVVSNATTGATTITGDTISASFYKTKLTIANGAVRSFTIVGVVTALPASKLDVTAAILRPADVTDPDATNPDNAVPSDALAECDSQPSGAGCNNIKTDSTTFIAAPKAGTDQVIERNTVATLTANTAGAWAQIGITPSIANIDAPASAKTTVSGLTTLGPYKFTFTNVNGCADTVTINVSSSTIDAPNVITPNGDGKNDTFTITGIDLYPGSRLSIYNRWGNEVFHSDNYANNWAGQGLAEGTYYYMYNRREKSGATTVFKGWIYLKH